MELGKGEIHEEEAVLTKTGGDTLVCCREDMEKVSLSLTRY